MLTHNEIKAIMAQKFKDEHCCFTEKDIKVGLINSHIEIQIRDYDHITYKLFPEKDDCAFTLPFAVVTYECWVISKHTKELVGYHESNKGFPFEEALVNLAYHIANTF